MARTHKSCGVIQQGDSFSVSQRIEPPAYQARELVITNNQQCNFHKFRKSIVIDSLLRGYWNTLINGFNNTTNADVANYGRDENWNPVKSTSQSSGFAYLYAQKDHLKKHWIGGDSVEFTAVCNTLGVVAEKEKDINQEVARIKEELRPIVYEHSNDIQTACEELREQLNRDPSSEERNQCILEELEKQCELPEMQEDLPGALNNLLNACEAYMNVRFKSRSTRLTTTGRLRMVWVVFIHFKLQELDIGNIAHDVALKLLQMYEKTYTKMVGTNRMGKVGTAYTTDDILSGDPREEVFRPSVYKAHILMLSELMRAKEKTNGDVLRLPKNKFVDGEFKGVQKKRNIISYEAEDIGKPKAPKGISAPSKRFSAWLGSKWSSTHPEKLPSIIGNKEAVQAYPNQETLNQYMEKMEITDKSPNYYQEQMNEIFAKDPSLKELGQKKIEECCTTYLKALIKNGEFRMRICLSSLWDVFQSERLLSCIDSSCFDDYVAERESYSHYAFGVPYYDRNRGPVENRHPKNLYEKYGYLGLSNLSEEQGYECLNAYGGIMITFKKDRVEKRCTVTVGDSLNGEGDLMPTPVTDPKLYCVDGGQIKEKFIENAIAFCEQNDTSKAKITTELLCELNTYYIELQYHGDLTIDDIENITFCKLPDVEDLEYLMWLNDVIDMCKKRNISISYLDGSGTPTPINDVFSLSLETSKYKEDLRKIFLAEEETGEDRKKYAPLIEKLIKEDPDFAAEKEKWKDIL